MPLMRRRPLLRAAAVGGGAYYMGKRRQEAQGMEAQQDQRLNSLESQPPAGAPPAAAPPGGISSADMERLKQLGELKEQGILTDEEFARQKAKLLG